MVGASQVTPQFQGCWICRKGHLREHTTSFQNSFQGQHFEYSKCGSARFPADSSCRKITRLASDSYLRVLVLSRKYVVTINISFELFLKAFMSVTTLFFFLLIDLAKIPLFDQKYFSECMYLSLQTQKSSEGGYPVESLCSKSS